MRIQRVVLGIVAISAAGLLAVAPVRAHHSFDAEFDRNKPIKVRGNIVKVDWVNPHSWIHVAVKKPDGKLETWRFEGGGPASLTRRGFTKDFTKWGSGTEVIVEGYLHRGVPLRASGRVLQYPDGRTLFVGSSGIGAPRDGADPSEK